MNRSVVKILVISAVLLLAPYAVYAHHYYNDMGYTCNSCHSTHKSLGQSLGLSNTCLSCHKPGNADNSGFRIKGFSERDMADPYGKLPPLPTKRMQTSHKWLGPDEVPEAGALPPTNASMTNYDPVNNPNLNRLLGVLSCERCHNVNTTYDPTAVPLLRTSNDKDQICLDCHRLRDKKSHVYGTHPVSINYTSATKAHPGQYYAQPVNSNPANSSASMNLNNGVVLCTTCHGVHFTDSNSRTFDNHSSAAFGRLSSAKGYLLRSDLTGSTVTDRNICTNCHKSTDDPANTQAKVKNHNGKGQNIQCADCHGGHVEYAGANPPANETAPNIFLINRQMPYSTASGRTQKVLFQYTSLSKQNWNKDANGVCLACHSPLPSTVSQHQSTDATVCASCHVHSQGFSANCTTCHGMPPVANTAGGPSGYANTPYNYGSQPFLKDESKSPHASHAGGTPTNQYYTYGCDECHKGNTHAAGTFQDLFIDKTGILAGSSAAYAPQNNAGPGTCNNVYCHSDGAGTYKPVPWKDGKGTIIGTPGECSACHNLPATSTSHPKHVAGGSTGKSYICANCHNATVDASNAIINKAKHVNGVKELAYSGTTGGITIAGCTSCHNDARTVPKTPVIMPVWGNSATGQCGACHANPMTNFAHPAHLTATYGPIFGSDPTGLANCTKCHVYTGELAATHVNGSMDDLPSACNTCHPGALPSWTGGRVTCESCHTGPTVSVINTIPAPDKKQAPTTGHGKPTSSTGTPMGYACTVCHDPNSQHINSNPSVHYTRLVANLTGSLNTECNFCHNNSTTVPTNKFNNMSTHFTTKGGPQAMQCWQCHELHGTNNLSMIASKIAFINSTSYDIIFNNTSTGFVNNVTNRGLCQVCHKFTGHYKAGVPETSHPDRNCLGCHPHNAPGGAFKPSGGCDTCHGYPPVPKSAIRGSVGPYKGTFGTFNNYTNAKFEDYSGGGGAHLNHVKTDARATEGWTNCAICHNGGNTTSTPNHRAATPSSGDWRGPADGVIGNVTVILDQRVNFNNSTTPYYQGASLVRKPSVNSTGICMNVACHFQPTPRWSKDR